MARLEPLTDRPAGDEPVGAEPGPATRAPALARAALRPAHVAIAILFAGALWIATTPINDLDSYWHVEIGREIVARHSLDGLGQAWLGVPRGSWSTSQWLSEVGMYVAVDRFGWVALPALRLLTAGALLAVLVVTLVRRRQSIVAFVVLLLVVVGLEVLFQDRPQTVSLVFLAWLGAVCERLWVTGRRPPWLLVSGVTLLWAQLHGLWVLAPAAFALVAVGGLLDRGRVRPGQIRGALISAAAAMAGVINPQGPRSFLLPLTFKNSGQAQINEWAPTTFQMSLTVCWGLLICLLVWAWVRSTVRTSMTELVWVFAWTVFGLLAVRNVGPSMLLLAPVAVRALENVGEKRLDRLTKPMSLRESRILGALLVSVVLVGSGMIVSTLARLDPLQNAPALRIARTLAAADRPLRVWNGYNASGVLIAFGGGREGRTTLVVDGRSDLWGPAYLNDLVNTQSLVGDWRTMWAAFRADAMVMPPNTPIVTYLRDAEHWRVAETDGAYVLIAPPNSPLLEH